MPAAQPTAAVGGPPSASIACWILEPDVAPRPLTGTGGGRFERKPLLVRRPSPEELADHQRVLAAIDKETRGGCLWLATADQAG